MAERDIVVVGSSVGGVDALQKLVAGLPENFPASVFVVLHVGPEAPSVLPSILSRAGSLRARHPRDGEAIRAGQIYVAPPDRHLILENGRVRLTRGPKENRHRPAIDPLFRSAAHSYGPRAVGVILTGALDDGTVGLLEIKKRGGVAIVQDPDDAFCASMPRSAIEHVEVDHVAPLVEIPDLLADAVAQPVPAGGNGHKLEALSPAVGGNGGGKNSALEKEVLYAELDMKTIEDENRPGNPSQFACPDCGGVLWEMNEGEVLRFRCRVGHAYTASSLDMEQTHAVENAVWAALRALEEGASLAKRMAERARKADHGLLAKRFGERAEEKKQQAELLRKVLVESKQFLPEERAV
jgi:two-component system chemotaxis response regulator CheB